ncbi:MAE_28990/MAE_18760 family HEPN-like nuclease [Burkholderia pseudomallei]|uniref:MAE_28990/MAE_18760 family HEPN-like nuclease n=1 Tax=Burkholderia pseudomallei TaxID=28450 RepID=UPI001E5F3CCA|nr:MAE_28990/MAE_18760 family HEPN-like nuclease [Burkholderia pseudomallei]
MNQLQEFLDQGFSWRLKEIADLKIVVRGSSSLSQATIIRAGVPLVYAHWEGFVKQASQDYLRYVTGQRLSYQELASCFVVFGAKKHLSGIVESRKSAINIAAVDFFRNKLNERADLALSNSIDAKSNLNYEVFQNIAVSIGISTAPYDAYCNLIDESLLKRRNGIAHGEYLDLSGDDFRALADEVIKLLRMYKTDIEILASNSAYKVV